MFSIQWHIDELKEGGEYSETSRTEFGKLCPMVQIQPVACFYESTQPHLLIYIFSVVAFILEMEFKSCDVDLDGL
jgi:hypothetical protein